MREEDKEVKYRPDLAKQLQTCLDAAVNLYNINFRKAYYLMLSEACKNEETDTEMSIFLKKVSECFDSPYVSEIFYEEYEPILVKKYNMELVSVARAACFVFDVYKPIFETLEDKVDTANLTKMERHMIHDFF